MSQAPWTPPPPLPKTTASQLWGILRSSEPTKFPPNISQSQSCTLPPIPTPVEKAGTTLRLLLHDTQANLERFSDRVDRLIRDVGDAKTEICTVQKLFEHDHEKIIDETVSLGMYSEIISRIYAHNSRSSPVNRCQTEIQKTLGHPAQAQVVDELRKDLHTVQNNVQSLDRKLDGLDRKLDGLDRKLDALTMVFSISVFVS